MQRLLSFAIALALSSVPALAAGAVGTGAVTDTSLTAAVTRVVQLTSALAPARASVATTGNGAPSGPHYNLNIIGVPKDKTADMTGSNGHVIFVRLSGTVKILLSPGDFAVLDKNGTDGTASFQLPNPDPTGSGVTAYSVYARALGKPGGQATATSCVTDPTTTETFCSTESVMLVRSTGKSTFENVSKQLLTVCLDTNFDGVCDTRQSLFASSTLDYLWNYDNTGLKLAQLRFYQLPTTVGTLP